MFTATVGGVEVMVVVPVISSSTCGGSGPEFGEEVAAPFLGRALRRTVSRMGLREDAAALRAAQAQTREQEVARLRPANVDAPSPSWARELRDLLVERNLPRVYLQRLTLDGDRGEWVRRAPGWVLAWRWWEEFTRTWDGEYAAIDENGLFFGDVHFRDANTGRKLYRPEGTMVAIAMTGSDSKWAPRAVTFAASVLGPAERRNMGGIIWYNEPD